MVQQYELKFTKSENSRIQDKWPNWLLAIYTPVVSESIQCVDQLIQLGIN